MKKIIIMTLCLAVAATFSVQSLYADQHSSNAGKKIMEERCTKCHGASRIKRADYDAEKWGKTIDRMMKKSRFGPELSDSEREALIEYLLSM
ncbi:MAG: c-type cytochrome [Desulfosalsimonas sp.]